MAADASTPEPADDPTSRGRPLTRAEQQARTRVALLRAAHLAFARDGFHGASLDTIARDAGYSKGAIYSNFSSKTDLFLAVMDHLGEGIDEAWVPASQRIAEGELAGLGEVGFDDPPTAVQVARGFSLATLEFAATAGRDEELTIALRRQLGILVDAAAGLVAQRRSDDESLDDGQLGFLVNAFDQGSMLFALVGWPIEDVTILQRGLDRLLQPAPDETTGRRRAARRHSSS